MRGPLVMDQIDKKNKEDKYSPAGNRKLVAFLVSAMLIMLAGYTMPAEIVSIVVMGIVGVSTAFITGNLIEHRMNRNRYNNHYHEGSYQDSNYD